MIEASGDLRRNRRLGQHLGEIKQEVVVIEHVLALLHLDVGCEQPAQRVLMRRDPRKPFAERDFKIALCVDDARIDREARRLCRKALLQIADAELMARPVYKVGRILAVMDGELRIEAKPRRIFAQEPRAEAMERSRIGRRRSSRGFRRQAPGEQTLDATAQLRGGAARKGGEHDALRVGAREDERRHPMRQHRRLARARAGDDEQRPGAFRLADSILHRELLLGIEFDGRARANQGERHGSTQPCFLLCSQERWTRTEVLAKLLTKLERIMSVVTVHAAKTNLSKLLARVEAGEEIVIARGKIPIARLTPIHALPGKRQFGAFKGVLSVGPEFFEPMTNAELAEWE